MPVTQTKIDNLSSGKDIYKIELSNRRGTIAGITNYGAILTHYKIPANGETLDIVVGFDDIAQYQSASYLKKYPYLGAAIGRYANRIRNGKFTIDHHSYSVAQNLPPNSLHGGKEGFDKKVWTIVESGDSPYPFVTLEYVSPDGEEGFPGNLRSRIRFELNDQDELCYSFEAETDAATIVNLTHHSYFNLNGDNSDVSRHELEIPASRLVAQDAHSASTGELSDVTDTRFDFRKSRKLGDPLSANADYDYSYWLDENTGHLRRAATAYSEASNLELQVWTTEPVVHLYTAGGLEVADAKGKNYEPYSAFCLETQQPPNAINIPDFPDTILRPGERYITKTCYRPRFRR